jgi:hypothetical protein
MHLLLSKEESSCDRLVLRSIKFSSHINGEGCTRFYNVRARLFKKDEEKKESVLDKVTSTTNSLDISKDFKKNDLKLDIRKQFENGETSFFSLETGLSEAIKKSSLAIIKKDIFKDGKFLQKKKTYVSNFKANKFNMMVGLDEIERKKILISLISGKWDDKIKRFVNMYEIMFDPQVLIFGYEDVLKVKGVITLSSKVMLNGISLKRIIEIAQVLQKGSWIPGVARRVRVFKKKSSESSFFIVLSMKDKIVASAITIVFNIIFEKHKSLDMSFKNRYFYTISYGFCSNKGPHSALSAITTWGFASWFIKADIEKCYDTINQKRFLLILEKLFKDPLMLSILNKFFNISVINVEKGEADTSKSIGVLQGNPLSSLLVNICLNEFDYFMDDLKKEIHTGTFVNIVAKKWGEASWFSVGELSKTEKALYNTSRELYWQKVKEVAKVGIDNQQNNGVSYQLYYVRYTDAFLVAVKSSKWLAKNVQEQIRDFFKFNLNFQLKEKNLLNAKDNKVEFLGFDVKVFRRKNKVVVENRKILSFKKIKNRLASRKSTMESRFEKVIFNYYEAQKLKFLKVLLKSEKDKVLQKAAITSLALKDALEFQDCVNLAGNKWISSQGFFKKWLKREFIRLCSSWIQDKDLKRFGFSSVIEAYNNLLSVMEKSSNTKKIADFKLREVRRIKFNHKKPHGDQIVYDQLRGLNFRLYAPMGELKKKLVMWRMLANNGTPTASSVIFCYNDISIIQYYKDKALSLLNYYKLAVNFQKVKKLVDYHMRWSLIHTLAGKHKKKTHQIIKQYGKTPRVILGSYNKKDKIIAAFLTSNEVNHRSRGFSVLQDSINYLTDLDKPIVKLLMPKVLFSERCVIIGCTNNSIKIYYMRILLRVKDGYLVESAQLKNKSFKSNSNFYSALNCKQILLCEEHYAQWPKWNQFQM